LFLPLALVAHHRRGWRATSLWAGAPFAVPVGHPRHDAQAPTCQRPANRRPARAGRSPPTAGCWLRAPAPTASGADPPA